MVWKRILVRWNMSIGWSKDGLRDWRRPNISKWNHYWNRDFLSISILDSATSSLECHSLTFKSTRTFIRKLIYPTLMLKSTLFITCAFYTTLLRDKSKLPQSVWRELPNLLTPTKRNIMRVRCNNNYTKLAHILTS